MGSEFYMVVRTVQFARTLKSAAARSDISCGLLGPLRGRTLVKDTLCWSTYQQDMAQ